MPMISFKLMFLISLIMGTLLSISSSSWFMIWAGLEINTMMFIPLIALPNKLSIESTLKYFFIQTFSSILFFFSSSLIMFNSSLSFSFSMLTLSLLMKLGAAPFHFWLPQLIEGLSWSSTMILLSWQKIIPVSIILWNNHILIYLSSVLSVILGTLGGLNQLSFRKLMSYSSISHMGWILMASSLSSHMTLIYFISYCFLSISPMIIMLNNNLCHISQIATMKSNKLSFMMMLLSMAGLPPFLGFLPKWAVLNMMISNSLLSMALMFILCAMISLIFYLRISYFSLMKNQPVSKWSPMYPNPSFPMIFITMLNLLSFPIFMFIL